MDDMEESSRVVNVELEKEIKKAFLAYSMSVIVSRALPDVRDGLKPVHRRIPKVRRYRRFRSRTLPSARRRFRLRCARAPCTEFLNALPTGGRAREFRLC